MDLRVTQELGFLESQRNSPKPQGEQSTKGKSWLTAWEDFRGNCKQKRLWTGHQHSEEMRGNKKQARELFPCWGLWPYFKDEESEALRSHDSWAVELAYQQGFHLYLPNTRKKRQKAPVIEETWIREGQNRGRETGDFLWRKQEVLGLLSWEAGKQTLMVSITLITIDIVL